MLIILYLVDFCKCFFKKNINFFRNFTTIKITNLSIFN
nr:MAG TPA: hypothetical protein [Caudoviricetes sp.]DAX95968.1 MAG TPA: hypothetical protein [Caudoviricetes sp.]